MTYKNELLVPCHCGNIRIKLLTDRLFEELPLRRCLCSYCTAHGNVYTSDSQGEVHVHIEDSTKVSRYRNAESVSQHTMYFLVCRTCGVVPAAISEIDGTDYAVVSVSGGSTPRLLTNDIVDKDFDEESLAARLDRRKATWTGRVIFSTTR